MITDRSIKVSRILDKLISPSPRVTNKYHRWYYANEVWKQTRWMGVPVQKSVSDLWNYQEIIFSLRPSLVIEFGSFFGGSALFFANILKQLGGPFRVLSVDINHSFLFEEAKINEDIEFMNASSVSAEAASRIKELRASYPGPVFAILDSDHSKAHVLAEMETLRPLLSAGDYLIVEDSNVNGHPVQPFVGAGPYEAIQEYERRFSDDYRHDSERENKFGFTFAPNGFLIRK